MNSNLSNAVYEDLCSKGAVVSPEWLTQCLVYLTTTSAITRTTKFQAVVDAVVAIILDTDLHVATDEVDLIPENIQDLHLVRLFAHQPRILQIDEVTDVGSAGQRQQLQLSGGALGAGDIAIPAGEEKDEEEVAADRRAAAAGFQGPRHLLKVYLTDGGNRVVALDTQGVLAASYQQRCASAGRTGPVPSLHAFYAGAKLSVQNVLVRRGAFLLTKDTMTFLGGSVHRLQSLDSSTTSNSGNSGNGNNSNNTGNYGGNNVNVLGAGGFGNAAFPVAAGNAVAQAEQSVPSSLNRNISSSMLPPAQARAASSMPPPVSSNATHAPPVQARTTDNFAPPHPAAFRDNDFFPQAHFQQPHPQQLQGDRPLVPSVFTAQSDNMVTPSAGTVLQRSASFTGTSNAASFVTAAMLPPSPHSNSSLLRAHALPSPVAPSSSAQRPAEMCDDEHTLDGNNSNSEEEEGKEEGEEEEQVWAGDMQEEETTFEGNGHEMSEENEEPCQVGSLKIGAASSADRGARRREMDVTREDHVSSDVIREGEKYLGGELFVSNNVDIYGSNHNHQHEGASSLSFDAFYDDVPFTSDGPLLTCDLTLSPSPNPFPSPAPSPPSSPPASPKEREIELDHKQGQRGQEPIVYIGEERTLLDHVSSHNSGSPLGRSIAGQAAPPERPRALPPPPAPAPAPKETQHQREAVRLSYWDEHAYPSPGQSHDQQHQQWQQGGDVFLVRCIASRVTRLKTIVSAAGTSAPGDSNSRVFQVHVELDDGHNYVPCEVSDSLVEQFLDMSAADHQALMSQLTSKQDKRQAQIGLMHRFQHFHGLFWACRRPVEAQQVMAATTAAAEDDGNNGPGVMLIDFALDQVNNVCASLLAKMQ